MKANPRGGTHLPRRQAAFTLVELLVVIVIIALLVAILMPALTRARQSASLIKCQANLRQMGQAIQIYAGRNADYVPWGQMPPPAGEGNYAERWVETLSLILIPRNVRNQDYGRPAEPKRPTISAVFQDQDTTGQGLRHYMANVRVFGQNNLPDPYRWTVLGYPSSPGLHRAFHPRKLASLKQSSDTAMIWCSQQSFSDTHPINYAAAGTTSSVMDEPNGCDLPGFWFIRGENPAYEMQKIVCLFKNEMQNASSPPGAGVRTRHMGNKLANILFADGHVTSVREDECIRRLFCVSKPRR